MGESKKVLGGTWHRAAETLFLYVSDGIINSGNITKKYNREHCSI